MGYSPWVTLLPNGAEGAGSWEPVGADIVAALGDGSDATYDVNNPARTEFYAPMILLFADPPALPAYTQVSGIQIRARIERPGPPGEAKVFVRIGTDNIGYAEVPIEGEGISAPPAMDSRERLTPIFSGWTLAGVALLKVQAYESTFGAPATTAPKLYQIEAHVLINYSPTTAQVWPTGGAIVSTTSKPLFQWLTSDAEGDQIERYQVQVDSGGAVVWDSGVRPGSASSLQCGVSLPNGSYGWSVRAADAGGWGPWSTAAFSTSVVAPDAPSLVAVADQAGNRMQLTPSGLSAEVVYFGDGSFGDGSFGLGSESSGPPADLFSVERSDDTGATWVPVRYMQLIAPPEPLTDGEGTFDLGGSVGWRVVSNVASGYPQRTTAESVSPPGSMAVLPFLVTSSIVAIETIRLIPVSPGTFYSLAARFLVRGTSGTFTMLYETFDAAGNSLGSAIPFFTIPEQDGVWEGYGGGIFFSPNSIVRRIRLTAKWVVPTTATRFLDDIALIAAAPYDYEGPRVARTAVATPVRYRANASRYLSGGELATSAWSTLVGPPALVGDCTTWLKNPYDPTMNAVLHQKADWETASEEDQGVFGAAGRADWGIFGGTIRMEAGEIEFILGNDSDRAKFDALRNAPWPLLLQTAFGDTILEQMWIRLGGTRKLLRVTHSGMHQAQQRRVTVGFHQVAPAPFI